MKPNSKAIETIKKILLFTSSPLLLSNFEKLVQLVMLLAGDVDIQPRYMNNVSLNLNLIELKLTLYWF